MSKKYCLGFWGSELWQRLEITLLCKIHQLGCTDDGLDRKLKHFIKYSELWKVILGELHSWIQSCSSQWAQEEEEEQWAMKVGGWDAADGGGLLSDSSDSVTRRSLRSSGLCSNTVITSEQSPNPFVFFEKIFFYTFWDSSETGEERNQCHAIWPPLPRWFHPTSLKVEEVISPKALSHSAVASDGVFSSNLSPFL